MKKLLAIFFVTTFLSSCGFITDNPNASKSSEENPIISDESQALVNAQTDNSFLQSAMSSKDKSFCENIQNTEKKNDCTIIIDDLIKKEEAVSKRDKNLCEKIKLENYKLSCVSNIEAIEKQEIEQEEINTKLQSEMDEFNAIEKRALNSKDSIICEEILDENIKNACIFNVVVSIVQETQDLSLCNSLHEDIQISLCQSSLE
jgi:hypothetical protein